MKRSTLVALLIFAITLGGMLPATSSYGQSASSKLYQLQAAKKDSPYKDDRHCSFFVWTTLDLTPAVPRLTFYYDNSSNVVRVANVIIILDETKPTPVGAQTGEDDQAREIWTFWMSSQVYSADAVCLSDIHPKKL